MLQWRPTSSPDVARHRAEMLARVRQYFETQDVIPVDTPAMSAFATSDPNIENFAVRGSTPGFLHTSPESAMKCLLAAGYPDIYSICRVFRDGESGPRHLPEFTLLEWYRLNYQLADIVADTAALIASCLHRPELQDSVHTIDYKDIFRDAVGVDVFSADCDELAAAVGADAALRDSLGADRSGWLDLMLVEKIMPTFAPDRLTVLQHYPEPQAALARICPGDSRVADRFEVFYGTLELANGYVELTDVAEQRRRFLQDAASRERDGQATAPIDELLLAALQQGLPDCAGVAVGLERLQMIYENTDDISEVVTFSARHNPQKSGS